MNPSIAENFWGDAPPHIDDIAVTHYCPHVGSGGDGLLHFSVDDVPMTCLNGHPSGEAFWKFIDSVHDHHGFDVDLYCFQQDCHAEPDPVVASDDLIRAREHARKRWVRVSPHALCAHVPLHDQTVVAQADVLNSTIHRLSEVGPYTIAAWTRFHYFSEPLELRDDLLAAGIDTVLLTDRDVVAYRLPEYCKQRLRRHGVARYDGLTYRRSHLRVEDLDPRRDDCRTISERLRQLTDQHGVAVVFTHEYELRSPSVQTMVHRVHEAANALGLRSPDGANARSPS